MEVKAKTRENDPFSPPARADGAIPRSGLGVIRGNGADGKSYRIEKVSPTKRAGKVVAHAIVRFGPAWVRYRIVNTERGLCVFPPANPCPGPYGRTYYRRSAGVDDAEIREGLEADLLKAYRAHVRAQGRRPPKPPPPRPRDPDPVAEALTRAAENLDVEGTSQVLLDTMTRIASDPDAPDRDRLRAAKVLVRLHSIEAHRLGTAIRELGRIGQRYGLIDPTRLAWEAVRVNLDPEDW